MRIYDLVARFKQFEEVQSPPVGIEYNGASGSFNWRFSTGIKARVNVSDAEPTDVMRAIAHLNDYLSARQLPLLDVAIAGFPAAKPADRPV